jgi:hypothetical protein
VVLAALRLLGRDRLVAAAATAAFTWAGQAGGSSSNGCVYLGRTGWWQQQQRLLYLAPGTSR